MAIELTARASTTTVRPVLLRKECFEAQVREIKSILDKSTCGLERQLFRSARSIAETPGLDHCLCDDSYRGDEVSCYGIMLLAGEDEWLRWQKGESGSTRDNKDPRNKSQHITQDQYSRIDDFQGAAGSSAGLNDINIGLPLGVLEWSRSNKAPLFIKSDHRSGHFQKIAH